MLVVQSTQNVLFQALMKVVGVVERKNTLPILANVLLRKNGTQVELVGSDLEIQIRTQFDVEADSGTFSTTLGARKLMDILRSLSADQNISLESQAQKILLKGGKSKFTLQTLPAEDFPLVQEAPSLGQAFKLPQKLFKQLLNEVAFAMAVNDIRYYLNGILFAVEGKLLKLVATDGHRLAYSQAALEDDLPKQEVILPRKTVMELQRLLSDSEEEMTLQFASNQAKFSFSGIEFVTKLVEGKFPDYNRVIPRNHKNKLLIGRTVLMAALQRAAILTSDKFKGVKLNFDLNVLKITASNAEQEDAEEQIDIDYQGDVIDIGFNVTYLTELLANASSDMVQIELQDNNASALFTLPENDSFKYVVMPMRI